MYFGIYVKIVIFQIDENILLLIINTALHQVTSQQQNMWGWKYSFKYP